MARRRRDSKADEPPEPNPPDDGGETAEGEGKRRPGRRPKLGNPDADPVRIHREYVERHLEGGGPATPDAYEKAIRQWQELPGAVSRPPAEVLREPEPPPDEEEDRKEDEDRDSEPPS